MARLRCPDFDRGYRHVLVAAEFPHLASLWGAEISDARVAGIGSAAYYL